MKNKKKKYIKFYSINIFILVLLMSTFAPVIPQAHEQVENELLKIKKEQGSYLVKKGKEKKEAQIKELARIKQTRIEQARQNTGVSSYQAKPAISQGRYIDIDISSQSLTCFENGKKTLGTYKVSTGKHSMPTPSGSFRVLGKENNHWSARYGLYMPYSMRIYGDIFIHELPYWPGGYREGVDHLGMRVSHGCIRLGVGTAKKVYDWANIGIPVVVHQ